MFRRQSTLEIEIESSHNSFNKFNDFKPVQISLKPSFLIVFPLKFSISNCEL